MSRLEKLKGMLNDDPTDIFVRYGLAMEYRSAEQYEEALELFDALIAESPAHVPSFFMKAQTLEEMDEIERATSTLQAGIAEAQSQGDAHAAGEMREMLGTL